MEYENIKKLMDDMNNYKLTALDVELPDGTKISMRKEAVKEVIAKDEINNATVQSFAETTEETKGNIVKSPMVGTFYIKPSPTANPYVEIGSEVKVGDVLCIVEAMKLMNEIESEYNGKIAKVLVKDGESVEYGTPLFEIL
ncbi:MAG: acetyl-CoA carboxylase biotin carboxyl carrier protein [Clostridia bacterium]|nr:acetyl-CoA carboxylase biotin carboxyl carrier protein [Clostridia bacterium]